MGPSLPHREDQAAQSGVFRRVAAAASHTLHSRGRVSPDLEPQGAEHAENIQGIEIVQPTPLPPTPGPVSPAWIPTRRWLLEDAGALPWSVEERQSAEGPSLFFTNDDGFVRVRDYPPNWHELPEAALAALLRHPRGGGDQA